MFASVGSSPPNSSFLSSLKGVYYDFTGSHIDMNRDSSSIAAVFVAFSICAPIIQKLVLMPIAKRVFKEPPKSGKKNEKQEKKEKGKAGARQRIENDKVDRKEDKSEDSKSAEYKPFFTKFM
jgi:hypothetical protein